MCRVVARKESACSGLACRSVKLDRVVEAVRTLFTADVHVRSLLYPFVEVRQFTRGVHKMAHITPSLSSDAMLLLEQSLLRVPVESMRKTYRTSSKSADKEMTAVETSLKKSKSSGGGAATTTNKREEKLKAVENALKRLEALKSKVRVPLIYPVIASEMLLMLTIAKLIVQLQDCQNSQKSLVTSSRARITHLQQLESLPSFDSRAYSTWSHLRLQRHLVDYLLRRGYTETAQTLALDENLSGLSDVDIELFKDLQRIEDALRSGSATEALQWCKDNASALKKGKVSYVPVNSDTASSCYLLELFLSLSEHIGIRFTLPRVH